MEALGKFTLAIILLILGVFMTLLLTHIVLSVANLYQLMFITQFSFVQVFGTIMIISLLKFTYKYDKSKEYTEYSDMFKTLITTAFVYLSGWGFAFIVFHFLK